MKATAHQQREPGGPDTGDSDAAGGGQFEMPHGYLDHYGLAGSIEVRDSFEEATRGAGGDVPYREEMERSFGMDFSGVRAFSGRGEEMGSLGAEAATRDEKIAFGGGAPSRELVAHELAHVAQQRKHGAAGVQAKDAVSSPSHDAEVEADAVASQAARGEAVTVDARPSAGLSLKGMCVVSDDYTENKLGGKKVIIVDEDVVSRETLAAKKEVTVKTGYPPKTYTVKVSSLKLDSYEAPKDFGSKTDVVPDWKRNLQEKQDIKDEEKEWGPIGPVTRGKANRDLTVTIQRKEVVLVRGTQVGIEKGHNRLVCFSGPHNEKRGTFEKLEDGSIEFEKELPVGKHEVYKDHSTNFVGRPKAISLDSGIITVEVTLQTRNLYDRVSWSSRVCTPISDVSLGALVFDGPTDTDDQHVQNPRWTTDGKPIPGDNQDNPNHYQFKKDFPGFGSGVSTPSALRTIQFRVNSRSLLDAARRRGEDPQSLEDLKDSDLRLAFGINTRYSTLDWGPSYKSNDADPYREKLPEHMFGVTAMSTPWQNGLVDMSAILKPGVRMSEEEYGAQPLPKNPTNNLELPFPRDYMSREEGKSLAPLVPSRFLDIDKKGDSSLGMDKSSKEIQLKLQTRIESEATLKIGTKQTLEAVIAQMLLWSGQDSANHLMKGDKLLESFDWKISQEGSPQVFNDTYLDDKDLHALKAGIGIRKRQSSSATKLNVKTGAGYQVKEPTHDPLPGEQFPEDRKEGDLSDIYRRHEIGFSLNPGATDEEISEYLNSGLNHDDPWNRGAIEANSGIEDQEDKIDFEDLQPQMMLIGHRTKFKIQATPKGVPGTINIEISCDHSVGTGWKDKPKEPLFTVKAFNEFLKTMSEDCKQIFNVEMELEHLGAGGAGSGGQPMQAPVEGSKTSHFDNSKSTDSSPPKIETVEPKDSEPKQSEPKESLPSSKSPPEGYPDRRPYERKDAEHENFNTPSFSVFYAAHNRLIQQLKRHLGGQLDDKDLSSDKQKLENIRDALKLVEKLPSDRPKQPKEPKPSPSKDVKKEKKKDTHQDKQLEPEGFGSIDSIKPDGNCLYNAVRAVEGLTDTVIELRARLTQLILEDKNLRQKIVEFGGNLNQLVWTVCKNKEWRGDEGDLVPVVLAYYIGKPICVVSRQAKRKYIIESWTQLPPVTVYYDSDHYEAKPPEWAKGSEEWPVHSGKSSESSGEKSSGDKSSGEKSSGDQRLEKEEGDDPPKEVKPTSTDVKPTSSEVKPTEPVISFTPQLMRYSLKSKCSTLGKERMEFMSGTKVEVLELKNCGATVRVLYDGGNKGLQEAEIASENLDPDKVGNRFWIKKWKK